jgi:RNA polymerase-binding transcription factor DksA
MTGTTRAQLQAQLENLENRLKRLEDHQRNRTREPSKDSEDHAIELQNEEIIEALLPKTRADIKALKKALARIDAGVEVTCRHCGEPIDLRRLAILPETETCARCA